MNGQRFSFLVKVFHFTQSVFDEWTESNVRIKTEKLHADFDSKTLQYK